MRIRELTEDDHEALRGHIRELQAWERGIDSRLADPDTVLDLLVEDTLGHCPDHDGAIFVADDNGTVAGYVCVLARVPNREVDEIDYDYALVTDLVVGARARGRGLGRALLERAEAYARERGARWLRIQVLAGNTGAWRLYKHAGFDEREVILEKPL